MRNSDAFQVLRGWAWRLAACVLAAAAGCSSVGAGTAPPDTNTSTPGNSGQSDDDANLIVLPPEENGSDAADPFANAAAVTLPEEPVQLEAVISDSDDIDIYDIGPVFAGDELVVEVEALSDWDAVAAVFDAEQNLIYANDDRAYYAGLLDPKIDTLVRHDSARCYVGVASSSGTGTAGEYRLRVTRTSARSLPEPETQYVYFNFDGSPAVEIGTRPAVEVPSFEDSLIAPEFDGQTDELIERIMSLARQDYVGLNVRFVSSREGGRPSGSYSTIHFGAYDADLLGVAENVDEYNEQANQQAIIFVDTFDAFLPLAPSLEEMAQAIANVASHETGHLLGLQHTNDVRCLMDITASLRQMLGPQSFQRSALDADVFPAGYQDAPRLLVDAVGGDLAAVKAASERQFRARALWYDEEPGPAARSTLRFSTCFCAGCAKSAAKRAARP